MDDLRQSFLKAFAGRSRRKAIELPSEWAEQYRTIKGSRWTYDAHPWLRDMHDSKAERNVGQKSAQIGYTETVLNLTFFNIDIRQWDCLYLLPNKQPDASDFSTSRFDPALEESEHLRDLFSDVHNIGHKRAGAANLYIRGATSRSGLKSIPVSFIVFDELDEMPEENIPLAQERVAGQKEFAWWKISTPTVDGQGINAEFQLSTQEQFIFLCPRCGKMTFLEFPNCLVVTGDSLLDPKLKDSYLQCRECKNKLDHETKARRKGIDGWLSKGYWEPFGDKSAPARGFYCNQLYSSAKICHPYELAQAAVKAQSDKAAEQEFYNSKGGLPHVTEGGRLCLDQINMCIKGHTKNDVRVKPKSKQTITMGIDVGTWLHCEIDLWNVGDWGKDINVVSHPKVIWEGKVKTFAELDALMRDWQVRMAVIDLFPERRMAYEFADRFYGCVKCCTFASGVRGKMINIDSEENEHKINVDRTSWLDTALGRFYSGRIDLPRDVSMEYREHLTKPVRRYKKDQFDQDIGIYQTKRDAADHFAFSRCYSEIALPLAASNLTSQNIRNFVA